MTDVHIRAWQCVASVLAAARSEVGRDDISDKTTHMNDYLENINEPHIDLAGLKLWVHGYQYPKSEDLWDGNWLNATAICSGNGATVMVHGAFIRTNEIRDWQTAVEKLGASLEGDAKLDCMEPELKITLTAKPFGAIEMEVFITPNQLTQEHRFTLTIYQSYLQPLSSQYTRLLNAFPIRGA